jgi:hypothetical protein
MEARQSSSSSSKLDLCISVNLFFFFLYCSVQPSIKHDDSGLAHVEISKKFAIYTVQDVSTLKTGLQLSTGVGARVVVGWVVDLIPAAS